jgi:hypothetical protein
LIEQTEKQRKTYLQLKEWWQSEQPITAAQSHGKQKEKKKEKMRRRKKGSQN